MVGEDHHCEEGCCSEVERLRRENATLTQRLTEMQEKSNLDLEAIRSLRRGLVEGGA